MVAVRPRPRAGTGAIHSAANGASALGLYGLFRHRPRFTVGYPLGVLVTGLELSEFTLAGDAIFSEAGLTPACSMSSASPAWPRSSSPVCSCSGSSHGGFAMAFPPRSIPSSE
jgi:hypothetical protein